MSFVSNQILDQIALDGLQGLTLRRLWTLLDTIRPDLKCKKDTKAQKFVSKIIEKLIDQEKLNVFILQDAEYKLSQCLITTNIYPVEDDNIIGSCQHYKERQNITDNFMGVNNVFHKEAIKNMRNIVLVANQQCRRKCLLPEWADPNISIKTREYCTLENIGRSRYEGIVFPNNKSLGRYRIMLVAKGFITQYQKESSHPIQHYLLRFSSETMTPKQEINIKTEYFYDEMDQEESKITLLFDDKRGELSDIPAPAHYCYHPGKLKSDRQLLAMVYDEIANVINGVTELDLRFRLNLPKFHLRNHLKNLLVLRAIRTKAPSRNSSDDPFRIYKVAHRVSTGRKDKVAQLFRKLKKRVFRADRNKHAEKKKAERLLRRRRRAEKNKKNRGIVRGSRRLAPPAGGESILLEGGVSQIAVKRRRIATRRRILRNIAGAASDRRRLQRIHAASTRFDDIDRRARAKVGGKRSSFCSDEDSFLVMCRITSLLLEPQGRLSWCVHRRYIRDLLHRHVRSSLDKTADACLRRIKQLTRIASNALTISELVAELRTEQDVCHLVATKPKSLASTNIAAWQSLFSKVLSVTRARIPMLLGVSKASSSSDHLLRTPHAQLSQVLAPVDSAPGSAPSLSSLLNRHTATSLLQLASPLKLEELNERAKYFKASNERSDVALLTAICTSQSFDACLQVTVPIEVLRIDATLQAEPSTPLIDASDALIIVPCEVQFIFKESNDDNDEFQRNLTKLYRDAPEFSEDSKRLVRLVRAVLAWLVVFPGARHETIASNFKTALTDSLLRILLNFMCNVQLLLRNDTSVESTTARLYGTKTRVVKADRCYEPTRNSYLNFCKLLARVLHKTQT